MNRFEIDRLLTTCRGYIQGAIKSYSNCMTQGEIEQWLYTNFLKIVESQENVIDAFIELKEWVTNEGMKNAIVEQLQEWLTDGTLSNIINEELFGEINDKIEKINEELKIYFLNTSDSGDISVIKYKDKNIMIDTGYYGDNFIIKNQLESLEINKLDIIIISHYHYDHAGGLSNLSYLDLSDCKIYLPQTPQFDKLDISIKNEYDRAIDFITLKNLDVIYPSENQILNIDGLEITFVNTNHNIYYSDINFDYNNCSLCCLLKFKDFKIFYSGDVALSAQSFLSTVSILKNLDVYKLEHHAVNGFYDKEYISNISPKINVLTSGQGVVHNLINRYGQTLRNITGKTYETKYSLVKIGFNQGNIYINGRYFEEQKGLKSYNSTMEVTKKYYNSELTIQEVIEKMERNSVLNMLVANGTSIYNFFSSEFPSNETLFVEIKKSSGGGTSTNDTMYGTYPNYFRVNIKATSTLRQNTVAEYNILKKEDGTFEIQKNFYEGVEYAIFNSNVVAVDNKISLIKVRERKDGFSVVDNKIKFDNYGQMKISISCNFKKINTGRVSFIVYKNNNAIKSFQTFVGSAGDFYSITGFLTNYYSVNDEYRFEITGSDSDFSAEILIEKMSRHFKI